MSETFLSRGEIAELTGAKTRRKQFAVLRANGIRHYKNAAGWPVVARSAIEGEAKKADDGGWKPAVLGRAA